MKTLGCFLPEGPHRTGWILIPVKVVGSCKVIPVFAQFGSFVVCAQHDLIFTLSMVKFDWSRNLDLASLASFPGCKGEATA